MVREAPCIDLRRSPWFDTADAPTHRRLRRVVWATNLPDMPCYA